MKMFLEVFICMCIGAGFGWFTATEWSKTQKESSEWKSIEPKKLVTKDDIKIFNWEAKKRCR